ncbi:MAG: hypothetical protein QX203_16505 [Methylococcaceae bacterium]
MSDIHIHQNIGQRKKLSSDLHNLPLSRRAPVIVDGTDAVDRDGTSGDFQVEPGAPAGRSHALGRAFVEKNEVDASIALHGAKGDAIERLLLVIANEFYSGP